MTAAIRTIGLTVGYTSGRAKNVVLDELNVSVRAGELVCLIGPNGAGKSTLIRTLFRIQPMLAGSVEIQGVDILKLSQMDLARRLGVVLTERPNVGALTALRIVELGRYPYWNWSGRMTQRDHDVVSRAVCAVGVQHLVSREFRSLSDGERQRFMIARALAQEPSILLLDEPTAFLDVPSRVELMGLLRTLVRADQLAVVVSTHDLELALRMADTIWLASEGKLHVGSPEDMILDGSVAKAFQATGIRFHPEERAFRLVSGERGRVVVQGEGLHAVLAAAVLEREGYEVVAAAEEAIQIRIISESTRWQVQVGDVQHSGEDFSSLAELVRTLDSRSV